MKISGNNMGSVTDRSASFGALPDTGRARIEALADSALDEQTAQSAIDELLASPELQASWRQLHQVGDYLRSEELAGCEVTPAFWQTIAMRLEQEPTLLAPPPPRPSAAQLWSRYGLPGLSVAAAVAMMSWLILLSNNGPTTTTEPLVSVARLPAAAQLASSTSAISPQATNANPDQNSNQNSNIKPVDPRVLRNYLAAHQQFSASVLHGPGSVQSASFNTIRSDDSAP